MWSAVSTTVLPGANFGCFAFVIPAGTALPDMSWCIADDDLADDIADDMEDPWCAGAAPPEEHPARTRAADAIRAAGVIRRTCFGFTAIPATIYPHRVCEAVGCRPGLRPCCPSQA
ncbi:hypothetical protein GCM10027572_18060 [Flexivirga lutea]